MAAAKNASESVKQIHYLAAALKAPRITEAAGRLADQARDAGWTHEDYLAAVLEREVSARNASGAELRIRAAGFPARKTLEDFDFDAQPAIRAKVASLASGAFLTEAGNIVLLGPPGTGKTHCETPAWESSPPTTDTGCSSPPPPTGSPASPTPIEPGDSPKNWPSSAATD